MKYEYQIGQILTEEKVFTKKYSSNHFLGGGANFFEFWGLLIGCLAERIDPSKVKQIENKLPLRGNYMIWQNTPSLEFV